MDRISCFCIALALGEALGFRWVAASFFWPVIGIASLLTALFGAGRGRGVWDVLAVFLLGMTLSLRVVEMRHLANTEIEMQSGPFDRDLTVEGPCRVKPDAKRNRTSLSFASSFPGGPLRVIADCETSTATPQVGEVWHCRGWLERVKDKRDHGTRRLWIRGRGTGLERVKAANPNPILLQLTRLRRALSVRVGLGLERVPEAAALNRAILLGERTDMSREVRRTFADAGTIHLFAISGLHVGIVAACLVFSIGLLLPLRLSPFVLIPTLWLYVAIIGMPPSGVRAAAMASAYYLAPLFWRRPNGLAAWKVTFLVFALVDPARLFSLGSVLSFVVMLGILLYLRWAEPLNSRLLTVFGLPFAAWAAGVPLIAHTFARLTPGGILANLILIPIVSVTVSSALLGLLFSFVSPMLAIHFNNAAALLVSAMYGVSWAVSRLPGSSIEIEPWGLGLCLAWYAAIILLLILIRLIILRHRRTLI